MNFSFRDFLIQGFSHSGIFSFRDFLHSYDFLYSGNFSFREFLIQGISHSGNFSFREFLIQGISHSGNFSFREFLIHSRQNFLSTPGRKFLIHSRQGISLPFGVRDSLPSGSGNFLLRVREFLIQGISDSGNFSPLWSGISSVGSGNFSSLRVREISS